MSQHDLNIANQTAPATRSDINSALQALGSNNSGSSAPSVTYANMHWYDTSTNILKQRSEADDAWISIGYFDQSTNVFKLLDDTMVVNTSGVQTGLIGDQATSVWQAGTGTTESFVSPAKVKSAINAFTPDSLGVNQTWQDVIGSRSQGTAYQNTTGSPIMVAVRVGFAGNTFYNFEVSTDNSTYLIINSSFVSNSTMVMNFNVVVPNNTYYRFRRTSGGSGISGWMELR
tara:strand:- start:294 stop:983 length:690 start_codon:yes stop_codon:yes gene_type:complete